jgi:hypothetical protein
VPDEVGLSTLASRRRVMGNWALHAWTQASPRNHRAVAASKRGPVTLGLTTTSVVPDVKGEQR